MTMLITVGSDVETLTPTYSSQNPSSPSLVLLGGWVGAWWVDRCFAIPEVNYRIKLETKETNKQSYLKWNKAYQKKSKDRQH